MCDIHNYDNIVYKVSEGMQGVTSPSIMQAGHQVCYYLSSQSLSEDDVTN